MTPYRTRLAVLGIAVAVSLGLGAGLGDTARAQGSDVARGITKPKDIVQLGPLTDGTVKQILVKEGDQVAQGQVLLQLDDEIPAARIALARAAAEATGDLHQAQAQYAEVQELAARTAAAGRSGGVMDWEMRQAASHAAVARAALDAAVERQKLEQRKLDLELAQANTYAVRAPFAGTVFRIDTAQGALLTRADHPITLADLSVLEATVYVPAANFADLTPGRRYPIRVLAPVDRTAQATLRFVDMLMDAASGRFRCVFALDNPDRSIPAGAEVEVTLRAMTATR